MRRQWFPTAVLVAGDLVAIWVAFEVSSILRVALNELLPRDFTYALVQSLFPRLPLVALCWCAALALMGAYDLLGKRSFAQVALETSKAVGVAMCLQIVVMFFATRVVYSRSVVLLFWVTSLTLLIVSRQLAFIVLRRLKALGIGVEQVAVVGTGSMARLLARKLDADTEPRFRLAGYLADAQSTAAELGELGARVLGHEDEAERLINDFGLSRLFVSNTGTGTQESLALIMLCDRMDVGLERVPDSFGLIAERVLVTELDGVPLISFRQTRFSPWQEAAKRSLDVALALVGLVLSAPIFVLGAIAIRLESPGPVLFAQRRVGRGGTHFRLLKFRSMYVDAEARRAELDPLNEADGHLFKMRDDPRVTRVGRLLRRWSLDELPQIFNVLAGDMSLVGPRPLPKDDLEGASSPYAYWLTRRLAVRPGITGLWQVSGRSQLPFAEMVNLDLHYLNSWSLTLDLQILLRTIPAVFRSDGAY